MDPAPVSAGCGDDEGELKVAAAGEVGALDSGGDKITQKGEADHVGEGMGMSTVIVML